jgi:hypothetical protein
MELLLDFFKLPRKKLPRKVQKFQQELVANTHKIPDPIRTKNHT